MSDIKPLSDSHSDISQAATTNSPALEQYQAKALKNVQIRKEEILLCLRLAGVARIETTYDGCGDSGQIENVSLRDAQGREMSVQATGKIAAGLHDFLYDLLEIRHPGWDLGDGSHGEFIWDIVEDCLTHTHNDRFTDYDTTEHEGV